MREINLDRLRTLLAVADLGSFAAAAKALHLAPPTVALPQPVLRGLRVQAWRRDPVLAFIPAGWEPPRQVTPAWLAARPLISNDRSTRLSRQTAEWFAAAGERPQARIELNYNDAMKS